jgi:primosomal protein N'
MQVMLYAEVIVATRTNTQELTYAISAKIVPHIRLGSLVMVPLRRKIVRGVVVGLRRSVPSQVKSKIKEILSVDRDKIVAPTSIKVLQALADYYGASLAEVAYHFLRGVTFARDTDLADSEPVQCPMPIYIQAVWPSRQERYLSLIRTFSGRVLLLFSQQEYLSSFERLLSQFPALKERCLLKTQSGAFSYLPKGSMIIVDQPYHVGSKSMRRPFMTTKTIAKIRAQHECHQLVIGNGLLGFEEILEVRNKKAKLISVVPNLVSFTIAKQTNRQGIGDTTLDQINKFLSKQKRVAIITPSGGWAPALFCMDCQHTIECPRCSQPIGLISSKAHQCHYCGYTQERLASCPSCQCQNLVEVGVGVRQLEAFIKKNISDSVLVDLEEIEATSGGRVVVTNEKYFSRPIRNFDLVVLIGWDRLISGVIYEGDWRLLNTIVELQAQTPTIIAETLYPEHYCWGNATPEKLRRFFEEELKERKRLSLPPYGQILAVTGVGSSGTLRAQQENLMQKIESQGYMVLPKSSLLRGKSYKMAFLVFSSKKLSNKQKKLIRDQLPRNWHLDVDCLA